MQRAKSEYAIQTVTNALRVLEVLQDEEELGVTELSYRLHLHKNNVFRLLATLEEKGYVEQSPRTNRYRLGAECLRLGRGFGRSHPLLRRARPILERLAQSTGETAHLGALRGFEVVHLDGQQSRGAVVTGLRIGERIPCHCTALGKVLLACGAPEQMESYDREVMAGSPLEPCTPTTLIDRDKIIEHLRGVAARGWATDLEEWEPGMACVAAPVYDGSGRVMAALSISGPAFRVDRRKLEGELLAAVLGAAAELSRALGADL